MHKIRILLANLPRVMREVVRDMIGQQLDMEIIGEFLDPLDLLIAAKEMRADAVIVALKDSEEPGLCSHLLAECPDMTILGLALKGDTAFIEQLCPWRREIANPSEDDLLNALRYAIRRPCSSEDEANKRQS